VNPVTLFGSQKKRSVSLQSAEEVELRGEGSFEVELVEVDDVDDDRLGILI